MSTIAPLPRTTPLIQTIQQFGKSVLTGMLSFDWDVWLQGLAQRVNNSAELLGSVTLTGQTAAIAATAFALPDSSSGLYRITIYARIATPASVSSSLQVTITTTDGAVTISPSTSAATGNTDSTMIAAVLIVRRDAGAPITYSTTYASVGTSMAYRLDLRVEAVTERV